MTLIVLPKDFIQPSLAQLHSEVCEHVNNKQSFELDGSLVERVDGAAIQFLLMCQKAAADAMECKLITPSEVLATAIEFLAGESEKPELEGHLQAQ